MILIRRTGATEEVARRFPKFVRGFVEAEEVPPVAAIDLVGDVAQFAASLPPPIVDVTDAAVEQGPDGIEVAR